MNQDSDFPKSIYGDRTRWHRWFAWYPVKITCGPGRGRWAFFKNVDRLTWRLFSFYISNVVHVEYRFPKGDVK
jgi:hypothetical protein